MEDLSSYFGPSERSKGEQLVRKDVVSISTASDTNVNAFIKASPGCRVTLAAEDVGAADFSATCSCTAGRKGERCKHIWAVLQKLEQNGADFLEGKTSIISLEAISSAGERAKQAKAEEYRAQQKQKLKDRNKEIKQKKKNAERGAEFSYPAPVQESLDYFAANGFPLENLDLAGILNARKIISRVFHPDKGGTHDEVLELNAHFETLQEYLK